MGYRLYHPKTRFRFSSERLYSSLQLIPANGEKTLILREFRDFLRLLLCFSKPVGFCRARESLRFGLENQNSPGLIYHPEPTTG